MAESGPKRIATPEGKGPWNRVSDRGLGEKGARSTPTGEETSKKKKKQKKTKKLKELLGKKKMRKIRTGLLTGKRERPREIDQKYKVPNQKRNVKEGAVRPGAMGEEVGKAVGNLSEKRGKKTGERRV